MDSIIVGAWLIIIILKLLYIYIYIYYYTNKVKRNCLHVCLECFISIIMYYYQCCSCLQNF